MTSKGIKTEHSGAKKGKGAFYGKKKDAKKISNRLRRKKDSRTIQEKFNDIANGRD